MKTRISILLFAVMMAGSLSAQIEEVSAEQYAPKKELKEKSSLDYLPKAMYPADLLNVPYNLIGQQLYCTQDHFNEYPIVALTISRDQSIGLKRLTKGTYYTVTNIYCARTELYEQKDTQLSELRGNILKSTNYLDDTLHYVEKGKEKIYSLSKSKGVDVPKLLPKSWIQIGNDMNLAVLYELTDTEGKKYLIGREVEWASTGGGWDIVRHGIKLKSGVIIAVNPSIGDFISVNTFNYLKAKYENAELVRCEYYNPRCQNLYRNEEYKTEDIKKKYIVKVEKIGINKKYVKNQQEIVFVFYDQTYGETRLEPYINEDKLTPSQHTDNINVVTLGINDGYKWALRSEADSLLNKWYKEEQIKEAQARAERAKQKAEYVKKYGAKYAQNIIDGKVCVGMTKEMCLKAMGRPNNTSRSSNSLGVVEVWTYSTWYQMFGGLAPIIVVTFLDDKVTSVDEYKENLPF
jgi:hypothetical protein